MSEQRHRYDLERQIRERDAEILRLRSLVDEVLFNESEAQYSMGLEWVARARAARTKREAKGEQQICGNYLAKPFPCIKSKGHDGEHESSAGQWKTK